jgi:tetratricopeptide (TPR) repeat protein
MVGGIAPAVPPPLDFGLSPAAPPALDFSGITDEIDAELRDKPADEFGDLPALAPEVGLPAPAPARRPAPPPKAARPAAPAPAVPAPPASVFGELPDLDSLDLPAPASEVGLPAAVQPAAGLPARSPRAAAPAPAAARPDAGFGHIDLPSTRSARQITGAALGFGEPDLPIIAGAAVGLPAARALELGDGFGELDLPLAVDAARDLPAATSAGGDLPLVSGPGAHLPVVTGAGAHLPVVTGAGAHLPAVTAAGAHLPSPASASAHLPSPAAFDQHLPSGPDSGAGSPVSLEVEEFDVPGATDPVWPKAPALETDDPLPKGSHLDAVDLGLDDAALKRGAGGGVTFGEVNLADAEQGPGFGDRALDGAGDEQFDAISHEAAPQMTGLPTLQDLPPGIGAQKSGKSAGVELPAKRSKAVKLMGLSLLAIIAAGAGLAATPYGAFGLHALSDMIQSGEHDRMVTASIDESRKQLAQDTAEGATRAVQMFDEAIGRAPRQPSLASYGAFVGFLREVRFGSDPAVHAHATALLAQAAKIDKDDDFLAVARAAEGLTQGQLPKARADIQTLLRTAPNDIDAAVLAGELELVAADYKAALQAWDNAARIEPSPRTAFGRARALCALGDPKCKAETESVLQRSPDHVGARILMARSLRKDNSDDKAMALLDEMTKAGKLKQAASKDEMVAVHTLLGEIHLTRSRMSNAEGAFAEALKLNPKDADALCGFGEVLYRSSRFAEALARFEAAIQANAESIPARIGAAKTKLALERLQDAKDILKKLREARPADPLIALWFARVEEALGNKSGAERVLADAVARALPGEHVIDLYVALARYLAAAGKNQEADAKLAEARQKLPDTISLHKALGDVYLAGGQLEAARTEFDLVLQRDPQDLYALFNLGVSLLRLKKYDEAQAVFDKVSAVDKNYPGLALERGVLFEVSGQAQRALEMYQEALSSAPNDPDLQLRVGSAEIANGHAVQAEEILRKVISARPNSAEANHYLGRALLMKGTNLAEALRILQRAGEIDPNRAEYWLYIGWAANEAGQPSVAQDALHKALELDKSLADAYWQRGILERRQSAVRDAERDLLKALELKPSRYEAHATLAECYEEGRRWDQAQASWRKAIAGDPNRSLWHYRLSRLLWTNHNLGEAGEEASKALQLAAQENPRPNWLWEAHMIVGDASRASGKRTEAVTSYKEFLKLAPPDSPYRVDVKKALAALGAMDD